jgi:hypothetical protein
MSNDSEIGKSSPEPDDSKARFKAALQKKKLSKSFNGLEKPKKSKVHGDQTSMATPKMFRRKSGSA